MIADFKEFIAKGNVMDLAVAVIIGGAFALIVASMTEDLIMPLIGAVFGGLDFSDKFVVLGGGEATAGMSLTAARAAGLNVFAWGNFVSVLINFLILAFIIFMLVRYAQKVTKQFEKPAAADEAAGPTETELLIEIRDEMRRANAANKLP